MRHTESSKGLGVYAKRDLNQGTIVWSESTKEIEFYQEEIKTMTAEQRGYLYSYGTVKEGGTVCLSPYAKSWLVDRRGEVDSTFCETAPCNILFINHSCEPNLVWKDERTLIAWRHIEKGEELTYDYGTEDFDVAPFQCQCGEKNCRGLIKGQEWRKKELRVKYGRYFQAHLLKQFINDS